MAYMDHLQFNCFAGIAGRAYYAASKIKLRRNRYLIRAARTQNMLLHSALFILEQKEMVSRKEASNLIGIRKQASDLRIKFDSLRKKSITNQIHVTTIVDILIMIMMLSISMLTTKNIC